MGLDVSLADTSICVIDQSGLIVHEAKVPSDPSSLGTVLRELPMKLVLIGLEAGQLSSWLYHGMIEEGLPVVCIESWAPWTNKEYRRLRRDIGRDPPRV